MKSVNIDYDETELDRGAEFSAVSYDPTQEAIVTACTATAGGKPVTAEINGVATGRGEDGTVNMWLSAFDFKGRDGVVRRVPGLNAVARLAPKQGAIQTAKAIATRVNASKVYKARVKGDRNKALINIVFAGCN